MVSRGWMLALAVAVAAVPGCKRTVEGEDKAWKANLQKLGELQALYPAFSGAIAEQRTRADEAMSRAREEGDPKVAAKKMADANDLVDGGWIGKLRRLESRERSLRSRVMTAANEASYGGARVAADDADRILTRVESALRMGAPDALSADVVLRRIDGDLSSAASNIDHIISLARERREQEDRDRDRSRDVGSGSSRRGALPPANLPAQVQKASWTCEYCGRTNDGDATKCAGCKAARGAAKAGKVSKRK
jgi:hypothetical protein